jgi:hypothetical protein
LTYRQIAVGVKGWVESVELSFRNTKFGVADVVAVAEVAVDVEVILKDEDVEVGDSETQST